MQNKTHVISLPKISIDKTKVVAQMKDGMTKEEIRSTYYPQLNKMQWKKALNKMGLNNVRVPKVDFEIVESDTKESCENTSGNSFAGKDTEIARA